MNYILHWITQRRLTKICYFCVIRWRIKYRINKYRINTKSSPDYSDELFIYLFRSFFSEGSNLHIPKNIISHSEGSILQRFSAGIYSASSDFFLRIVRLRFGFSSATGLSILTPANSGSMRIRPQYSQGIIFLCILMSYWRWGGILLKQPPHASRCT